MKNDDRGRRRSQNPTQNQTQGKTVAVMHATGTMKSQIIPSTANVLISDIYGNEVKCRALLDGGSMSNFITRKLASKLNLYNKHENHCSRDN